jgi:hypothetical protein
MVKAKAPSKVQYAKGRYLDVDDDDDQAFEESGQGEYERDVITGRRSKRPKMSLLNKGKLSKQEMDELFLEY